MLTPILEHLLDILVMMGSITWSNPARWLLHLESGEHTAGLDSMSELRAAIKKDVMQSNCPECGR
jgi:hypothetical protein